MNHTKFDSLKVQPTPATGKPFKTKGADAWNPFKKSIERPPAVYQNESWQEAIDRILGQEFEGKTIGRKK